MSTRVVFTGQLRTPGLLVRTVEDACALAQEGVCDEVVLSTWTTELDRLPWLADLLLRRGVRLIPSEPIAVDTFRNYRRQQHLLDSALHDLSDTDVVVKLRPDWIVARENLAVLCRPPAPPGMPGEAPVVLGRVRLPWWTTRVPFHLADESMSGYAGDIRKFNPADARLALADPHAGRYVPYLLKSMPALRFADDFLLSCLAEAQLDTPEVIEALGGFPPRPAAAADEVSQQLGLYSFDLTTMALDLPSYQRVLACYLASVGYLFEIYNPTPDKDQFIERKGPWAYTTVDVHTVSDPLSSADPFCFLPERFFLVARRRPAMFAPFCQAVREYQEEPALMFGPADDEELGRDGAELRRRVDAFRMRRLQLTPARMASVPVPLRRAPLYKALGPAFSDLNSLYDHAETHFAAEAWGYLSNYASGRTSRPMNNPPQVEASCVPRDNTAETKTSTSFLGIQLTAPMLAAPIGRTPWLHPDDRRAVVRVAAACGLAPVIAEDTYWSLDAATAESDGPKLMQLHTQGPLEAFETRARRAEQAGFAVLCAWFDPDLPSDIENGRIWETLAAAATDVNIPLIIAGALTADDVEQVVAVGAAGLLLTSRRSRPSDGIASTLDQLSNIVSAVRGRLAIAVDSGIQSGRDIHEALMLGADAVLVGWPLVAGLSAAGQQGAQRALELLTDELRYLQVQSSYLSAARPAPQYTREQPR